MARGYETPCVPGSVGEACRRRRKELGLTQAQVMERAGLPGSNATVSLLETGRLSPTSAKGSAICAFLSVATEPQDVPQACDVHPDTKGWARDLAAAMDERGVTCAKAAELSDAPSAAMVGYLLKGSIAHPDVPWVRRLCQKLGVPQLQDWTEEASLGAQVEALARLADEAGPDRVGPGVCSSALVHAMRRQAARLEVTPAQAAVMANVPEAQAEELLSTGTCPSMTLRGLSDLASAIGVRVELSADGPRDPAPKWWDDEDLDYAMLWLYDAGAHVVGLADDGDLARALGLGPDELDGRLRDLGIDRNALMEAACREAMSQVDWARAVADALRAPLPGPKDYGSPKVWRADGPAERQRALRALSVDPGLPPARPEARPARLCHDTETLDAGPFVLRRQVTSVDAGDGDDPSGLEPLAGEGPWRLEYRTALDAACSRTDAVRFTMAPWGALEVRDDGDDPRRPRMSVDDLVYVYTGWGWRVPAAEPLRRVPEADRARLARLLDRYRGRDARKVALASGGTLADRLPCDAVTLLEALEDAERARP